MKILTTDIETTPHLAQVWGLWNQNIGLSQLRESAEILCVAYKWHHKPVQFAWSDQLDDVWRAMDEADAIVTWNGDQFDLKHLNREFLEQGHGIPAPYVSIDLLKTVRKQFKFPSNKLDYVAQRLLGERKLPHAGHQLWIDCMAGDEKAMRIMQRYNERDVRLTEKLYDRLLPWIPNHPSVALRNPDDTFLPDTCPTCGSSELVREGLAFTAVSAYQRYHCKKCGRWSRGVKREKGMEVR